MSADQLVDARQKAMKEDGETLKDNFKATGQAAVTAVNTVEQNFTNFPALFAGGATNAKSHALPIIWTEYDKFTALFDKGKADLEAHAHRHAGCRQIAATTRLSAPTSADAPKAPQDLPLAYATTF